MRQIFHKIEVYKLEENLFYYFCEQMMDGVASYFDHLQIIQSTYLMKLKILKSSSSRFLLSSILKITQKYPRAVIDSLLIPLFSSHDLIDSFDEHDNQVNYSHNNEQIFFLNNAHSELVTRIIKDSFPKNSNELLLHFFRLFLFFCFY